MSNKKYWRIGMVMLLVGLLALGSTLIAMAEPVPTQPDSDNCLAEWEEEQAEANGQNITGYARGGPLGEADLDPFGLLYPQLYEVGYLKIPLNEDQTDTGWYYYGHPKVNNDEATDDGFRVYIWNNNKETFDWVSNYPVSFVWVKGGAKDGILYSYNPASKCGYGLKQSDTGGGAPGTGWSHIVFYYIVPQTGCMEIVKVFEDYPDDWDLPESITVTIAGKTEGLSYTMEGEEVIIARDEDSGEYVWKSCDIIPGEYIISKIALPGWDLTMDPEDGEVTVLPGSDPEDLVLVTLTNTFQYGCLEVIKLFEGYPDDLDPEEDLPESITVTIAGDTEGLSFKMEGEPVDIERTYDINSGKYVWEWKDCKIIPGNYTVSKTALPGWNLAMSPADGMVTVAGGADAAVAMVTLTNTYITQEARCETAWAYHPDLNEPFTSLGLKNWGWTNGPFDSGTYTLQLWAGAGRNDLNKGTLVGTVKVVYDGSSATVTYILNPGYTLKEAHLYVGNDRLPKLKQTGAYTNAPGQFPYKGETYQFTVTGLSGDIYVAAHAVVCGDFAKGDNDENGEGMGMPAKHEKSGEEFGKNVSEKARGNPGAIADHVKKQKELEVDPPQKGRP